MRRFGATIPILGVCLGHQCIGAAYGGDVVRACRPVHGRTSLIDHDGSSLFAGLPSPLHVARYHSLVIARTSLPPSLRVIASAADDGEVMAVSIAPIRSLACNSTRNRRPASMATRCSTAFCTARVHGWASFPAVPTAPPVRIEAQSSTRVAPWESRPDTRDGFVRRPWSS